VETGRIQKLEGTILFSSLSLSFPLSVTQVVGDRLSDDKKMLRLQVLAVVLGDGGGDGGGGRRGGGDGGGDTPARADGGVADGVAAAGGGVGGEGGRDLGGLASLDVDVAPELGGGIAVDGDGDGDGGSLRGDGGLLEAGAVGLAGLDGQETLAGTGDLTGAVVGGAGTLVEGASHDGGSKGEDGGDLHLDG
jgi:hypothetical protein